MTAPAAAPDPRAIRAAALRLLEEADAAGIGVTLQMGSRRVTSHPPSLLVHSHYPDADPLPLLRRATDVRWKSADHGEYDAAGTWRPRMVEFFDGVLEGVAIQWNGTSEQAARLRAALATNAPLETPAILADMSAQDALDTVASAG